MPKRFIQYFALIASLATVGIVPGIWILVASRADAQLVGRNVDVLKGPSRYVVCVLVVAALWVVAACVIRRRSVAYCFATVALISTGGLFTLVASLGVAFNFVIHPGSQNVIPPQPVADQAAFLRARAAAYGSPIDSAHPGVQVVRKSWNLDEYGTLPDDQTLRGMGIRWVLPWEEYGLPLRSFRSQYHFGWPRPGPQVTREWFSAILAQLAVTPVPLMCNIAIWSGFILVCIRAPGFIVRRHRRQEGRCETCGYILNNLNRCPECGSRR